MTARMERSAGAGAARRARLRRRISALQHPREDPASRSARGASVCEKFLTWGVAVPGRAEQTGRGRSLGARHLRGRSTPSRGCSAVSSALRMRSPPHPAPVRTTTPGREPMARCIDLFIDSPASLDELAATLGTLSGLSFVGSAEGTHWGVRDGEGFAELAEHDFDDDRQLLVSKYRYDLFARVESGSATEGASAVMLRRIF